MRDHILSVAENLFYSHGIRAVGIDLIIAEAKIAKATLYRHFASKEDLVEAYLSGRHERIVAALTADLHARRGDPRERLLTLFDILEGKATSPDFRGCAFLMAVAEYESSPAVLRIARAHKAAIRGILLDIVAGLPVDTAALASDIALCYEGALATIAVSRQPDAARVGRRCAGVIFDAAIAAARQTAVVPG